VAPLARSWSSMKILCLFGSALDPLPYATSSILQPLACASSHCSILSPRPVLIGLGPSSGGGQQSMRHNLNLLSRFFSRPVTASGNYSRCQRAGATGGSAPATA
jgi:hypothetical protein